jgi:hypothetical protein
MKQIPAIEVQLQKAFQEGMARGRLGAWHDGYKEGFHKGRAVGNIEAKKP